MASADGHNYFAMLCVAERRAQYQPVIESVAHNFVVVDDPVQLLARCVQGPPLAVLVDTASIVRIGSGAINPLFDLHMGWPILRCTVRGADSVNVICNEPDRQGSLTEAVNGIAAGDPSWLPPRRRRWIRALVQARAVLRVAGEDRRHHSNCLSVSRCGAFVVTYEDFAIGTTLDLVLRDLLETPMTIEAKVAWQRRWDDSTKLPGLGLEFEASSAPEGLTDAIVRALTTR